MEWPTRRPSPHLRGHCWHGLPSTWPLRSDSQLAVGWMKGDMKSMADQVESKVTTNMQQTIGKHDGKMQQLPPSRAWRVFPWALQNGSSRMWASFFATLFIGAEDAHSLITPSILFRAPGCWWQDKVVVSAQSCVAAKLQTAMLRQ